MAEDVGKEGIICKKCGTENLSTAKFCINCGNRLYVPAGEKISDDIFMTTFVLGVVSLADISLNTAIWIAVSATPILFLIALVWLISSILIILSWIFRRKSGLYISETWGKVLYLSLYLLFGSYITFFIIFILVGNLLVSPLWIIFGYIIWRLRGVGKEQLE